ncbi:MAG: SDR family NAD(P)-dependent oxidoreductase [Chloroflexi bacterium]|nr:SDR family NAD(P)-dependent oxidoreductase [Chloroflexota bacterium]
MDLELRGKVAVVTGGSRGIGKAIARELALEGADIALVARNAEALEATRRELEAESGRTVIGVIGNTSDDDSVRAMARTVLDRFGHVDILINAAAKPGGQQPPPRLHEIDTAAFDDELHTKVLGYLRCAREFVPSMKERGWGRIVNISGLAARSTGTILGSIRNVSVVALTKNLADELGPHGINVTVVHPGTTRTEKTVDVVAARAEATGQTPEEVERQLAAGNSIRHLVDSQEVAYVVTFLCSPKSIAINGDVIAAGGGAPRAIHY